MMALDQGWLFNGTLDFKRFEFFTSNVCEQISPSLPHKRKFRPHLIRESARAMKS